MTVKPSISAVLPAYNEEANLERAVRGLAKVLQDLTRESEIIVVDDGSRDGSAALLSELGQFVPSLRVVTHPLNRGYGAAVRSGFQAARMEWVFLMDADNQFDPSQIQLLINKSESADIVAGYRRRRQDPLPRRLNAWAFFSLVSILFGRLATDVNCAFKLIRRSFLGQLDLRAEGALINTELFVGARARRARIVEVPVQHYPRTAGRQTGANPRVVLRAFRELFEFWRRIRRKKT
jgi:glycosyltransferase involved in cell wall biosynthesis